MAMPHRRRGTALFMVDGMEDKSVEILRRPAPIDSGGRQARVAFYPRYIP